MIRIIQLAMDIDEFNIIHIRMFICGPFSSIFVLFNGSFSSQNIPRYWGGVVCASESKINVYCQIMLIANNTAIDIGGSIYLSRTNISFLSKHSTIVSNEAKAGHRGAIFARGSQLTFASGYGKLVRNKADHGGAIYARESKLIVEENSRMNLSTNLVLHNGGGLYLIMSELNTKGTTCTSMKTKLTVMVEGSMLTTHPLQLKEKFTLLTM